MSKQIIQIEELIYKRMPKVSAQEWLAMLKEQFCVDESYGLLLDDYLLQEQTDNYYIDGHLVDSERIVYNINHSCHISSQPKPTISEEDTWEDPWVQYDASNNRYIVRYCHYLCEDLPHVTNQLCEADMPIHGKSTQAPPETKTTIAHTSPVAQPVSLVAPKQTPTLTQPIEHEVHFKKWKQRNLSRLNDLYSEGYTAQEIAKIMNVTEEGLKYQLTHYLGRKCLFMEPNWKPRQGKLVELKPDKTIQLTTPSYYQRGQKIKHHLFGPCVVVRDDATALIVIDKFGKRRVLKK